MKSIAIILPDNNRDYLANTILDGFRSLEDTKEFDVHISPRFITSIDYSDWELDDASFIDFARKANLIIYIHAKYTRLDLVEKIGLWEKTVCVDGNEVGKNNRYDPAVRQGLIDKTYVGLGAIQEDLLKKCRRYFRREKPYIDGIIPLPFGIENRFVRYKAEQKKDIDFTCIFGQDEYPLLRRQATEALEEFCSQNGFSCKTTRTNSLFHRDPKSLGSQTKFHDILARTKVGISIGGGGFDTLRFWEILANDCALLTETIDIYEPESDELKFKRIFEFKDLEGFRIKLEELGKMIRSGQINDLIDQKEYMAILNKHSSAARVRTLINLSL